jgi:hypothetical protein
VATLGDHLLTIFSNARRRAKAGHSLTAHAPKALIEAAQNDIQVVLRSQSTRLEGLSEIEANDAPALKAADTGISVDTAVDIAKESSNIILLENSLLVQQEGVIEGRRVFGNIIKYIKMAASSNFGNMFSVVGDSLFLPFLPMLPIQVLANFQRYAEN